MGTYFKLKQLYRYLRNWKKLQSRHSKNSPNENYAKEIEFYSQMIGKGDLCFDVGANVGDKSALFIELGAKVIAIEPQESCWRILKRRFKNLNVIVETVALASKSETKTLFVDRSHTLATMSQDWIDTVKQSGRFSNHAWPDKLTVQTTTLDALIKKHGVAAFCKIDVEGFEFDVLQGLSQPIRTISLEFIPERIDASLRCIDYLDKLGKAEFNYCLNNLTSFALSEWDDREGIKATLTKTDKSIENYGDIYVRFVNG